MDYNESGENEVFDRYLTYSSPGEDFQGEHMLHLGNLQHDFKECYCQISGGDVLQNYYTGYTAMKSGYIVSCLVEIGYRAH